MHCRALPKKSIISSPLSLPPKILDLSQPHIMGILNVTPDSFSDGGQFNQLDNALRHCEQMIAEGATIIDIGGESTRPNADTVSVDKELNRVLPVVEAIRQNLGQDIWLSIDTSTPQVIEQAVKAGADIWNDVRSLKRDGATTMAAKLNIPIVLMHMRGEPKTMGRQAHYQSVVEEVMTELTQRVDEALSAGVALENIILDPGFGFAKNYNHHIVLLKHLYRLHELGLPLLFGVSRKRFLGEVLTRSNIHDFADSNAIERDNVGMAAALLAVQQGVSIIRTHNVGLTKQGLTLLQQLSD